MADNPYVTVGAPSYAAPIINWFGHQNDISSGRMGNFNYPQNGQQQGAQGQQTASAQPQQPGYATQLGQWLQKSFAQPAQPVNAMGQNPNSGGMGLPQGNQTGSLY